MSASDEAVEITPDTTWPSTKGTLLPSRAFLRSWRDQSLPARRFALQDAVAHMAESVTQDPPERDMALLGVIGEAMQPLEDLAYLGSAWDKPFTGLPNYVRAITYGTFIANNFWQQVPKWDDEQVCVFAGHSGRDPHTGEISDVLSAISDRSTLSGEHAGVLAAALSATVGRVRADLSYLSTSWQQFAPYFHAYKHGGLAISRNDVAYVEDDVVAMEDSTPRRDPSIAVWTRGGRRQDLQADFSLSSDEVSQAAASAGWLAIHMVEAFVESRLAPSDALVFDESGNIVGMRSVQIPWSRWLRQDDLSGDQWQLLGAGPTITVAHPAPADASP